MPKLKALVAMRHIKIEVGQTFDVSDSEANILITLGKAKLARAPRKPRAPRDPSAPKRAYRRRDMRAEA